MVNTKLLIVGAGGHDQSVAQASELNGQFEVVGFADDALAVDTLILGYPVLGPASTSYLSGYASVRDQVFVAIGNNAFRASVVTGWFGELVVGNCGAS